MAKTKEMVVDVRKKTMASHPLGVLRENVDKVEEYRVLGVPIDC